MDTSDREITFDENGVCNHCLRFDTLNAAIGYKGEQSRKELERIVAEMKKAGEGHEYDCILGISGGVDSSYLAYLAHSLGLRILAVHVDAGWNSEVAVSNIEKICRKLDLDLHTIVIDWPTMKELQRAYMFSGLANLDVPQDHAFIAAVAKFARESGIRYILSGGNLATEGILPPSWSYNNTDSWHMKDVYKKHGRGKSLAKYPFLGFFAYREYMRTIEPVRLLNLVPYSLKDAIATLEREFGWEYYGGKHYESRFTKFFQAYYLPKKFGYDKKRAHLSSLVVGGEMTREQALEKMADDSGYTEREMLDDRDYILKKLDISAKDWDAIMAAPPTASDEYRTNKRFTTLCNSLELLFTDPGYVLKKLLGKH